ncbi:hypothetical protein AB0M20_18615, partial [Actinoplanes sp. NPDC051633]
MPDDALARLIDLVPPPSPGPAPVDWDAVDRQVASPLPSDYRAYVSRYGLGCINGLYWVLHPHGTP